MNNRHNLDRESFGPDFDDRLIHLVRSNPAIYDVSHPHYRRNPIRIQIWDKIAKELGATSRFIQTKWKNIRYNYLQELKNLETGHSNTNVRKRRFTADLSFLKHAIQAMRGEHNNIGPRCNYSSSDTDSNSYLNADNVAFNAFEVIEIEHSDVDDDDLLDEISTFRVPFNGYCNSPQETNEHTEQTADLTSSAEAEIICKTEPQPEVTIEQRLADYSTNKMSPGSDRKTKSQSPSNPNRSNASTPLLTPIITSVSNGIDVDQIKHTNNNNGLNAEITIEPITSKRKKGDQGASPDQIMAIAAKRKAKQTSLPMLTPINDPIELYCLSLVDSLRAMPRSERERVKYEFAKILKDATYRTEV